jgi:hypothetical protein
VDENPLDLHQAFAELRTNPGKTSKLTLRVGRQEMMYGSQRLVAVRDGPNNRQSFDAAKLLYQGNKLHADIFYAYYVRSKPAIFDDRFNDQIKFWGSYLAINKLPLIQNLDIYYLGLEKTIAGFDDGVGRELRHSLGSRIWHNKNGFRFDAEAVYQFGKFTQKDISASTASLNTGYKFANIRGNPEISLKAEMISGDKVYGDNKLQTFNPLFPKGNYFGLAALVGPANLIDLHPALATEITKQLTCTLDYDAFWRYSRNDGIYAANTSLIYSGRVSAAKFIGHQYAIDLVYTPNHFLYFRTEFTWFKAGRFIKETSTGKDILFAGFTSQLRF